MLGLPHQSELVNFYEDYFAGKYSSCQKLNKSQSKSKDIHNPFIMPNQIFMLGHKLFVIDYQQDILHATDGLNGYESLNLVAMPVMSNKKNQSVTSAHIIMRMYRGNENYS